MTERDIIELTVCVSERARVTYTQASRAVDAVARRELGMHSSRELAGAAVLPAATRDHIISLAVARARGRVR